MALTIEEQEQVARGLMRWWSRERESVGGVTKTDLLGAVDATDDYIQSIQAAYNSALPTAARNNLTTAQKTLLFCAVAMARISIAFLGSVMGEMD